MHVGLIVHTHLVMQIMPFHYNSVSQYDANAILDDSSALVHQYLKHMGRFEVQNLRGQIPLSFRW